MAIAECYVCWSVVPLEIHLVGSVGAEAACVVGKDIGEDKEASGLLGRGPLQKSSVPPEAIHSFVLVDCGLAVMGADEGVVCAFVKTASLPRIRGVKFLDCGWAGEGSLDWGVCVLDTCGVTWHIAVGDHCFRPVEFSAMVRLIWDVVVLVIH